MNSFEKSKKFFLEGIELYSRQNYKEAVIKFTNSLELEPNRPSILLNLSKSYLQIKQLENAKNNLEKIIKLNGFENEKKEALNLLLNIYFEIDDFEEINKLKNINNAEEIFNNKDYVKLQFYYPKLFNSLEEIPNARNEFRGNIKKLLNDKYLPKLDLIDDPIIPPNFSLSYDGYDNLEINNELISIYKKLYPKLNDEIRFSNNKNKKIKIGFISEFFTNHTIIKLFEGLIYKLDKSKFDVFVIYSDKTLPGSRYDEIKRNCILYNYENVFLPKNFSEKVEIIKEHNLDILFYTDIHMSENLYFLTLLKLARYQITSWGHPETTGNSKIDFFLSSILLETDNFKKKYSEKVLLSKYLPMYFYKPKVINNLKDEMLINKNVYSCPQNLIKMHPSFDFAIKEILNKDKKARVYFIKDKNENITKKFSHRLKKNISTNMDRVFFMDKLTVEEFINNCGRSSVLLDPFIFGAGNSFHESMYYGTPTVTMPTDYLKSRIVTGAYKQMEIDNAPIAKDLHEYVELSIEIANNGGLDLKKYYQEQANKNLFENEKAVKDLESIFFNINNN